MQVLLNADGTLPEGRRVTAQSVLTMPVPPPSPDPGMMPVDLGDGHDVNGVWTQKWTQVPLPPPGIPASVTPLQARRALRLQGMLATVEALIAAGPVEDQDTWEYMVDCPRSDPLINKYAEQINLTDAQVDSLYVLAATL